MKNYRKLGFDEEEAQEIVDALNALLANYHVHYQKLRNFHWNIVGPEFFELHGLFEQEYNQVKLQIDEIAERIRVFGKKPHSTLAKYLEVSEIEEPEGELSATDMAKSVLGDFEILLSFLVDAQDKAAEHGDLATSQLVISFIQRTEKMHWMLTAFVG